jgi:hypothetical protein
MGFKQRDVSRKLRLAVLQALPPGRLLSNTELLSTLRDAPGVKVSVRKIKLALSRLIDEGRIIMEGARARARFRRAIAVGSRARTKLLVRMVPATTPRRARAAVSPRPLDRSTSEAVR